MHQYVAVCRECDFLPSQMQSLSKYLTTYHRRAESITTEILLFLFLPHQFTLKTQLDV